MSQGTQQANRQVLISHLLRASQNPITPVERSPSYQSELNRSILVVYGMIGGYVLILLGLLGIALGCVAAALLSGNLLMMIIGSGLGFGLICLLLALLKPLLVPKSQLLDPFQLNPKQEPVLFEFVGNVCKAVGAPAPSSIVVTHDVNVAASFEKGTSGPLQLV
jgi:hypothetical protein